MKKVIALILVVGVCVFVVWNLRRSHPAPRKLVTIHSRNLSFQVVTMAKTVGEVLAEQGYDSSVIVKTSSDSSLRGGLKDDEAISSSNGIASLTLAMTEKKEDARNDAVESGTTIHISRPVQITLTDGGTPTMATTTAETVADFLRENKITLAVTDRVTPDYPVFLGDGAKITIDRIVDLEVTETHDILFTTKLQNNPDVYYGREQVLTAGQVGKKEQTFLITYKNGVETKRRLLSQKTVLRPVTEVREFGTKIEVEEDHSGAASWYNYKGCLCAAHPFYDKGRYARVTDMFNGKSVIVRINDRGPDLSLFPDRIIDLDSTAFKRLAPLSSGTIGVRVELLKN